MRREVRSRLPGRAGSDVAGHPPPYFHVLPMVGFRSTGRLNETMVTRAAFDQELPGIASRRID